VVIDGPFKPLGHTVVASDELRRHGRTVGYEVWSGGRQPHRDRSVLHLAVALKGGDIMGRVIGQGDQPGPKFYYRGPIQAGNGEFAGIAGRIVRVENATTGTTRMRLRWHIAR
jgi:hypothetical protein